MGIAIAESWGAGEIVAHLGAGDQLLCTMQHAGPS
jgi:hypothetical protein